MTRTEALDALEVARQKQGLTYEQLAERVGQGKMWVITAMMGQHYVPPEIAKKFAKALDVPETTAAYLSEFPYRGNVDPVIYRLQEIVDVYGPSIKAAIHEMFGDGIMSAIDFSIDVDKQEDPNGDRVVITLNGKFLPYKVF